MSDFEHAGSPALVRRTLMLIAKNNYPDGAIAKCKVCSKSNEVTMERVVEFMQNGFPVHCGQTILLKEKP